MSSLNSQRTVTAFYDQRSEADAAVSALRAAGVRENDISVTAGMDTANSTDSTRNDDRGFFEKLGDFFMPEEDRSVYVEGLRRGGYLVAVSTSAGTEETVYDILEERGSIDLDERATTWRSEGWEASAPQTTSSPGLLDDGMEGTAILENDVALGTGSTGYERAGSSSDVVPVVEERLTVGKRDVSHGRVRIRSYVVETPVTEQVSLHEERVSVERRPVDRLIADGDAAFREVTLEAEETGQEAVVTKEARVLEEIALTKQQEERVETVTDTVRRQDVEIEDDRIGSVPKTHP